MACVEYAQSYCVDAKSTIETFYKGITKNKELKTKKNSELRKLKAELVREKEKRKGNVKGLEHIHIKF